MSTAINEKEVNFAEENQLMQKTNVSLCITYDNNLSLSEDDEEFEYGQQQLSGSLSKWTNYLHGWQKRYFILRAGTLSYYKSETETTFGCRGAVSICKALIQPHEFDECRFDISLNDSVWYLRAESYENRQKWVETLEAYKAESGYGSQNDLRRHGSLISLTSNKSLASTSSVKKARGLKEKLAELETFRDIVCKQIDTLQSFFDSCVEKAAIDQQQQKISSTLMTEFMSNTYLDKTLEADEIEDDYAMHDILPCSTKTALDADQKQKLLDFKGEALTFKATTSGILSTLQFCIDVMHQRDEGWRRKLEKEIEKRKKSEEALKRLSALQQHERKAMGPDYEEGPHSAMNEEEWHDAVDAALDRQDIEDRRVVRLLRREHDESPMLTPFDKISLPKSHRLYAEIDRLTIEQVKYAKMGFEDGFWQLFAEDGEMKMYKREVEIDGMVCDPLKAVHSVKGVTAREYLHYFFEPEYKMDWDTTLESISIVERPSQDTCIMHQVHKRVWPASQRESLFWSHFRRLDKDKFQGGRGESQTNTLDQYVVCNHDTHHAKVGPTKNIRLGLTVAMLCETTTRNANKSIRAITRDDLTTKIIYVAQVNPGGWAPSSVLRAVYKREYPKFLKRFTQYVLQKVDCSQIRL